MPYKVTKQGQGYAIRKQLPGGHTKTVGHSSTKAKAQASVRARNAAAHGAKLGGRR
jgi:hypothetical protein